MGVFVSDQRSTWSCWWIPLQKSSTQSGIGGFDHDLASLNSRFFSESGLRLILRATGHLIRDAQLKWSELQGHNPGGLVSELACMGNAPEAAPNHDVTSC